MFKDGWARFGFGDDLLSTSPTLPFVNDYRNAVADDPRPVLDLSVNAARHIYETMPKPLTLLLSGGSDSQAMAYAFKLSGVPHEAVFFRFRNNFNAHDFLTAPFYRRQQIAVTEREIDILDFHNNHMAAWAERYQNHSPHHLTHLRMCSEISEGTVVSSGSIVHRSGIGLITNSGYGFARYAEIEQRPIVGYFFSYDKRMVGAATAMTLKGDDPYARKIDLYQRCGFPVLPQKIKYHGFEALKTYYDEEAGVQIPIITRMRYRAKPSKRNYDLLFRYPLEDIIPYSDSAKILI